MPWPLLRAPGVVRIALGPDGRTLAVAGDDGLLRIADLELGVVTHEVPLGGAASALAATASMIVVAVGATALCVHAHGGRVQHRVDTGAALSAVAVSPDGMTAVVVGGGRRTQLRLATGRTTVDPIDPTVCAVALGRGTSIRLGTTDGRLLGGEGVVSLGAAVIDLRLDEDDVVALLADGRVVDGDGVVRVAGVWTSVAVDAAGRLAVAGPTGWGRVPDVGGRDSDVIALALHPDGAHAVLARADGGVGLVRG